MKRTPRKLSLQRETLVRLEAQSLAVHAAARTGETCAAFCDWISELYTACSCPPTWPGCPEP